MLVGMCESLLNPCKSIRNKADAMHFAILVTMKRNGCGEPVTIDYDESEKLFKFFCDHVEFPEEETKKTTDGIMSMLETFLQKGVDA